MSYIPGVDLAQYQGDNINFAQVKAAGYLFGITRMTYAYPGRPMSIDPTANKNYYGMVSVGMLPGGYHKVGWTDPIAEADFFLAAMSPLAENDLLSHDMEPATDVPIPDNWADWEQRYVQRVYDRTGVWSMRYENISMNNLMPRHGVVSNSPSWVAAPSFGWNDTLPVSVPVTLQQGPAIHIPGITANVCDTDMFFGEGTQEQLLEELKRLGYHAAPVVTPVPVVTVTTIDPPVTTTTTVTTEPTVPIEPVTPVLPVDPIAPVEPVVPQPVVVITKQTILDKIKSAILAFIAWLVS